MYAKERGTEKNICEFNKDVNTSGGYLYTNDKIISAALATERQTKEIINFLQKYFDQNIHILDVGCGDGTYTFELFKRFKPKKITAFDTAENAIMIAKENNTYGKSVSFEVLDIYKASAKLNKNYDVAIIRGVLHHLYDPQAAIKEISQISDFIIVLEPNGYNPLLKLIEKISAYHIIHEERSFFPPVLNSWFTHFKYKIIEQKFFGIIPYFFPARIAYLLNYIERYFESIPLLNNLFCGTNIVLFSRQLFKKYRN